MADQTIDDILREAKAFLAKRTVVDDANTAAEIARSGRIVERGPDYTYGDVATETLNAASIPAMFLSGPAGMAAGAYNAIRGLKEFGEKPGLMSGATAALGMLPFTKVLKGAKGLKGAAQGADEALLTAEQTAPYLSRPVARTSRALKVEDVRHNIPTENKLDEILQQFRFSRQTPAIEEAAETVAAPGFSLGAVTPMSEVPVSRAKQAAEAMQRMGGQSQGRGWISRQPETHADWLAADAVPFPRAKTLRSDESLVGLARELDPRVQELNVAPYPGGTDELARALRQRARIGQHYAPQEALAAMGR